MNVTTTYPVLTPDDAAEFYEVADNLYRVAHLAFYAPMDGMTAYAMACHLHTALRNAYDTLHATGIDATLPDPNVPPDPAQYKAIRQQQDVDYPEEITPAATGVLA